MRRLLPILLLAAACGHLHVEVSALDPQYVEPVVHRMLLEDDLPRALAQTDQDVTRTILSLEDAHKNFYVKLSGTIARRAAGMKERGRTDEAALLESVAGNLQDAFGAHVDPVYQEATRSLIATNAALRQAAGGDTKEILLLLRQRRQILDNLFAFLREDMDGFTTLDQETRVELRRLAVETGASDDDVEVARAGLVREQASAIKSLLGGGGLTASPYAHAVASAPDEKWGKRYDEALGEGFGGNLNIAIKMEALGNFTIKGVTFDPSDVARVAAKVGTQTILLAAQAAGVPVRPLDGAKGDGAALGASSKRLADLKDRQAAHEAAARGQRDALLTLADAITAETLALQGPDDEVRKRAISSIGKTYDAHKERLKPAGGK